MQFNGNLNKTLGFKMDALTLMIILVVYTLLFVGFAIFTFLGWIDVKGSIYISYVSILLCSIAAVLRSSYKQTRQQHEASWIKV